MATFDGESVKGELNQYWYSQHTIRTLLSEVTDHAKRCAFLSTPSLYFSLASKAPGEDATDDEKLEYQRAAALRKNSRLFEFDRQWQCDAGFVFYDFQRPDQIPVQYMGCFDYVVVDPPFITREVWARYVETIKLIIKPPEDPVATTTAVGSGRGEVRDSLRGGKVLFTTVLENHTMLEGLINGPLFIPRFRPNVCHLVYQYVCFLNYNATRLRTANPEVPEDDPESCKLWAAIDMANDIRHSETAFALQMKQRDREGEALLPTIAHEQDVRMGIVDANGDLTGRGEARQTEREDDVAQRPISEMRWSYVPEGLTMYPEGNDAPPPEGAAGGEEEDPSLLGPVFVCVRDLRTKLDDFKGRIDKMQKLLDTQMKLRHHRVKLTKAKQQQPQQTGQPEGEGVGAETDEVLAGVSREIEASEAGRTAHLDGMALLASAIVADERELAKLKARERQNSGGAEGEADTCVDESAAVSYEAAMSDCISAYRAVEVKKVPLQELAADATRKFKSPVFSRMKELLQEMKEIKKAHRAAAEVSSRSV